MKCGNQQKISHLTGVITTPNYPSVPYLTSTGQRQCAMTVEPSAHHHVRLTLLKLTDAILITLCGNNLHFHTRLIFIEKKVSCSQYKGTTWSSHLSWTFSSQFIVHLHFGVWNGLMFEYEGIVNLS